MQTSVSRGTLLAPQPLSLRSQPARNLQETLEYYVAGVLKGLLAFDNATAHSYTELLVRYRTSFHNYSVGMQYGSELFSYLDRHWINTNHCETGRSPKDGVSAGIHGEQRSRLDTLQVAGGCGYQHTSSTESFEAVCRGGEHSSVGEIRQISACKSQGSLLESALGARRENRLRRSFVWHVSAELEKKMSTQISCSHCRSYFHLRSLV